LAIKTALSLKLSGVGMTVNVIPSISNGINLGVQE